MLVRGSKVMLDSDLADLYGVPTGSLVQAVQRNRQRFPPDFMFQLTEQEVAKLEITICDLKFRRAREMGRPTYLALSSTTTRSRALCAQSGNSLRRPNPSRSAGSDSFRKNS